MGKVTVVYGIAFLLELRDDCGHIDRMPDDHGIRHQVEAQGLGGQFFRAPAPSLALIRHHQDGAQIV
jgi:hypothetical protein